jgi:hypothetical protein
MKWKICAICQNELSMFQVDYVNFGPAVWMAGEHGSEQYHAWCAGEQWCESLGLELREGEVATWV